MVISKKLYKLDQVPTFMLDSKIWALKGNDVMVRVVDSQFMGFTLETARFFHGRLIPLSEFDKISTKNYCPYEWHNSPKTCEHCL